MNAKMKQLKEDLMKLWKLYVVEERLLGSFTCTMSQDEVLADFFSYVEEKLKMEGAIEE